MIVKAKEHTPICTHKRNGELVPHVSIPLGPNPKHIKPAGNSLARTPIVEIRVGPALDFKKTEFVIKCLLDEAGITNVKIKQSRMSLKA